MPIPHLKRRTYGYIDKKDREARPVAAERLRSAQKRGGGGIPRAIFFALALPVRMFAWFFKKIAYALATLWSRRPMVSKKTKREMWRRAARAGAVLGVFGILFGTGFVVWATRDLPDPDRLTDRQVAQSTKIYDRSGEHLLYEIFSDKKRTIVELSDIPKHLVNGLIATEDKTFYQHVGVRPLSILRAVAYGLLPGKRIAGTSTITQQLVKNAILTNERTTTRKAREIIMALRLEQKYTKDQILKIYFNEIPYGSTNYGVESASQSYFGKHVSELSLAESATLAGFPKSPSSYLKNPVALKNRRDFVLLRMREEGYITTEEMEAAQAEPVALKQTLGNIKAPHFVMYVKEQLVERYGEQMVDQGGLKVMTSLDWEKQEIAEKVVAENEKLLEQAGADNTSLVSLDPKTGHILAMVGSRDFFNKDIDGQFNVAADGERQPGSSFKPMIYAAALEKGYTPDTLLFDVSTNFAASGKPYIPQNYDGKERGPVTMRQALQGSLNIPAVQMLYLVGVEKGVEFAERMGYTTLSDGDFGLSLVLGGGAVRLLEHAAAYAVLANNGVRHPAVSVLKVEKPDGSVLEEWKGDPGELVVDAKVTAMISDILSDDASRAYIFGRGGVLTLPDRPVAAKTGTTNGYVDAWTMGYTPSMVTGVWAGNSDNSKMKEGAGGYRVAGQIWHSFMKEALKNTPPESFPPSPPNDAEKAILRGSAGGGVTLLVDSVTGKIATSSTPEQYIAQRTYYPPHSILHYVDKDNPRGPVPEHPESDPQYAVWEAAIQSWVERRKAADPNWSVSFSDPPTEKDDLHSLELVPTLEVVAPASGATLFSRAIEAVVQASAPRGIARVTYQVDGKAVATEKMPPFGLKTYLRELPDGSHTLLVIAEDDIGNSRRVEVPFTLSAGPEPPGVSWAEKSYAYGVQDFPRLFFLRPYRLANIKEIRIYASKDGEPKRQIETVTDFSSLFDGQLSFKWNDLPSPGLWRLVAETVDDTGAIRENDNATVLVR